MVIERLTNADVLDATYWVLTIGTIGLLVAYVLATLGAIRFLFFGGRTSTPKWQIVVPILAIVLLVYTLYKNAVGLDCARTAGSRTWSPCGSIIGVLISFRRGLKEQVAAELSGSDANALVP